MSIDQMIRELRSLEEKNKDRTYSTFETKWNQVCHDTANKLEEVLTGITELKNNISSSVKESQKVLEELFDQQRIEPEMDLGLTQFYNGRFTAQVSILKDLETLVNRIECERD